MTRIYQLAQFLESIAPLPLQETYDNAGLLIGNPEWEIQNVLCCLDATEAVLDEAKKKGCNVVVSHHPIVFKGLKQIQGRHYVDRAVIYAIKNDIALYAIHTNLDNIFRNGVNEEISRQLGLEKIKLLLPKYDSTTVGAGMIGLLPQEMEGLEFLNYVKKQLDTSLIRHTRLLGKPIQKVAVTGGAGAFLIPEAIRQGADAYITGDVKYHEFFEANDQMLLCDVGHFESEQFTISLLARLISENFTNFATHCTKTKTNPVQYF